MGGPEWLKPLQAILVQNIIINKEKGLMLVEDDNFRKKILSRAVVIDKWEAIFFGSCTEAQRDSPRKLRWVNAWVFLFSSC